MVEYERIFSFGLDAAESDVKEKIDELIAGWSTDEMMELLGECEFVLSNNEGRIEQLEARGLKRLWYIITGINKKNKQSVRRNVQEIQKISFSIQKILIKRIDFVSAVVISLNDKVNEQIFWTQDVINQLYEKIDRRQQDIEIMNKLLMWHNTVHCQVAGNGTRYIDASDGMKILLVASDLFRIVYDRSCLVERPFLEATLQKLGLGSQIHVSKFYSDIIYDHDCLTLYSKDYYNYNTESISDYGRMIHKISGFYSDPYLAEVSESIHMSLESMCEKTINDQLQDNFAAVPAVDLCQSLLDDLAFLNSEYQIRMKEQAHLEETIEEIYTKEDNVQDDKPIEYSVIRITPEGLRMFKDGDDIYNEIEHKSGYAFSNEKMLKAYLDSFQPYMITAPIGYWNECATEIKNIFMSDDTVFISLADYYMYLWFHHMSESERKNRKVAVIEYYDYKLYVSGYVVNVSGDEYSKGFSELKIRYNRTRGNIIRDIMSQEIFSDVDRKDVLMLKTFYANAYIDGKLEDKDIKMVDDTWENIWKTDSNEIGKMIQDLRKHTS